MNNGLLRRREALVLILVLLIGALVFGAVYHRPFPWRSLESWANVYPNGSAKIWQHWDSLFVDLNTGNTKQDSEVRVLYPLTDQDSLFTPTTTIISSLGDTTFVKFCGKWGKDTNGLGAMKGITILSGEGVTIPAVWDSLVLMTDSAFVRVWTYGHPEW